MRFLLYVTIFLSYSVVSVAQTQNLGFNLTNERNKPHLEWLTAETEHFIITYPSHLAGIEAAAAAIAEETYEALSNGLNVQFEHKIRVYLSDEDEIINGYAVPIRQSFTNIWVNLNDVALAWSGPEKWLRTVLAHELAHIFHFEAVKSNVRLIGIAGVAPALPAPWTEGIAQYLTEPWHAFRGDELLRKSIYDGRPSFRDDSSPLNGGLMYASGNSQLRYFTDVHGDTTLAKILAHRDSLFGGLITWHNFNKSFKKVTDQSFNEFQDEWRRHMNIYYHTLAGQMERSDSLGNKPESVPGYFVRDMKFSPDTTQIAVVSLDSPIRMISQLNIIQNDSTKSRKVIFEGSIGSEVSWSPDSRRIAFSATTRGEHGSLINDVYIITLHNENRQRLTHSRRASRPQFTHDGTSIIYVVNTDGTGNLVQYSFVDRSETQLTSYSDDTQIGKFSIHPDDNLIAYARFSANGSREIVIHSINDETSFALTDPEIDDRDPIWSPDGTKLAYTSLRDYVPNLFVIDPFADELSEERVTALFTGGNALQWLPSDSTHTEGRFVLSSTDTKRNNSMYRIDASRRPVEPEISINSSYTSWLTKRPDNPIATQIPANASLITHRGKYNSWKNISHVSTIPFPYFADGDDYGIGAISVFAEPLGNHLITVAGALSFTDFSDNSLLFGSYMNNQFRPSWSFNAYHNSFTGRIYERDYLVTTNSGAFVLGTLPRDWIDSPFVRTNLYTRFGAEYTDANRFWEVPTVTTLPQPESGWQTNLRIGIRMNEQKPYAHNEIHPLDGQGFEVRSTFATRALGGETEYIRPDIKAYSISPGLGKNRFYLYGRAIAQWGDSFTQDYVGFSRFDDIQFGGSLEGLDFLYSDTERVRGFSDYVIGNRLLFGTMEYRMPLFDSLNTEILGLVSFGRTTLAAFIDGGVVWSDSIKPEDATARAGTGAEIKNVVNVLGISFVHSLGFAQPVPDFATDRNQEIYYRIRAVVPF